MDGKAKEKDPSTRSSPPSNLHHTKKQRQVSLTPFQCLTVIVIFAVVQFDLARRNAHQLFLDEPSITINDGIRKANGKKTKHKTKSHHHHHHKSKPGFSASKTDGNGLRRYLLFFPHSGFSNQLLGLQRAAQLAAYTSRVLVLPPLLPHFPSTEKASLRYEYWGVRGATCPRGNTTEEIDQQKKKKFDKMVRTTELYAKKSVKNDLNKPGFPTWKAIVDFDAMKNETGLMVMDLPQFYRDVCKSHTDKWSLGTAKTLVHYDGRCDPGSTGKMGGKPKSYKNMLKTFADNFHNNTDRIAFVGSAFDIKSYIPKKDPMYTKFNDAFRKFTPSREVSELIEYLRSKLPTSYGGAHVRLLDGDSWESFNATEVIVDENDNGDNDRDELRVSLETVLEISPLMMEQCPPAANSPGALKIYQGILKNIQEQDPHKQITDWFVGSSHSRAKDCFQYFMEHHYPATAPHSNSIKVWTLEDIMDDDPIAASMADRIQAEPSTLELVLDQFLLSMANTVATTYGSSRSTFQTIINARHAVYHPSSAAATTIRTTPV